MKIASCFAGVGGIELGFDGCEVVYANEIDKNAVLTYERNFNCRVDNRDILEVDESSLPDFDILMGGFPCQAFSVAGNRMGFDDKRGKMFFELMRIAKEKKPQVIFLENVKNLVSHDGGNTFRVILMELDMLGYHVKYKVLNASEHGNTPQNRERIYIVAFRDHEAYQRFEFPESILLTSSIEDIVDFDAKVDDKYYYTSRFKHFELLEQVVVKKDRLYQWRRKYVRENKSGVCPTLTANMGMGGHNVPIALTRYGMRKLTPRECFLFQGFPEDFVLPDISDAQLYKQAGNSVCVGVIRRIATNLLKACAK